MPKSKDRVYPAPKWFVEASEALMEAVNKTFVEDPHMSKLARVTTLDAGLKISPPKDEKLALEIWKSISDEKKAQFAALKEWTNDSGRTLLARWMYENPDKVDSKHSTFSYSFSKKEITVENNNKSMKKMLSEVFNQIKDTLMPDGD